MSFLKSLPAKLASFLALYGGRGIFAISFLDSSILSLPFVNDLLLIHLASQYPIRALVYALLCTAGSVLGASALYAIALVGGKALWHRHPPPTVERARRWLTRNDFLAILVASLLPPPAPFKIFALSAGVLRVRFVRFAAALLVGRGLRFMTGALIGIRYGARAELYLRANIGWVSLAVVAALVGGAWLYRRLQKKRSGK